MRAAYDLKQKTHAGLVMDTKAPGILPLEYQVGRHREVIGGKFSGIRIR